MTVSTNPGRYLCNYIYFKSYCQQARVQGAESDGDSEEHSKVDTEHCGDDEDFTLSAGKNKTVFIHVPPFDIIDKRHKLSLLSSVLRTCVVKTHVIELMARCLRGISTGPATLRA